MDYPGMVHSITESFLQGFGSHLQVVSASLTVLSFTILILCTVSPFLADTSRFGSRLGRIFRSEIDFILSMLFVVLWQRLPVLLLGELNADEGAYIAAAVTFVRDPRYWV